MRAVRATKLIPRLAHILAAAAFAAAAAVAVAQPASALSGCSPGVKCPRAIDDSYQTTLGSPLNVAAPGLLANDQGAPGTTVDVADSDTTSWLNADVSVHADGSFTYTPDATNPATGIDSFDYYIQDPAGGWDLATANVTVNAVIRDDSYSTPAGRTLSVKAPGVLANDLGYDRGSLSGDTTSAHGGDVTVNDDGSFQYTPPAGFQGTDTFTYTVSDTNDDNSYTATAHIGVASPAPPATQVVAPNSTTSTTVGPGGATAPGNTRPGGAKGPRGPAPVGPPPGIRAKAAGLTTTTRATGTTANGSAKPSSGATARAAPDARPRRCRRRTEDLRTRRSWPPPSRS